MIFDSEFQDDHFGSLVIENYPNLEKIIVKNYSLRRLRSLKICNCDELKSIEIKDGELREENGNGSFSNVNYVTIESIFELIFLFISS